MKGEMTGHVARIGQQGNAYSHRDFRGKIRRKAMALKT
jgi:hypothetical protein